MALGGDGTWGNVARGILESGRDARLVPVAAGTGNDFPHALGLPAGDPVAMARIAAGSGSVRVDVGWANDIAFLNVAGLGLETEVAAGSARDRARSADRWSTSRPRSRCCAPIAGFARRSRSTTNRRADDVRSAPSSCRMVHGSAAGSASLPAPR